jgi:AcrR family transcriptional regulator
MEEEFRNILEKVRCLYLKYGIKSITMDDVSRELCISKKTLYQYVTDKSDLVAKVLDLELKRRSYDFNTNGKEFGNAIEELILVNKHVINLLKEYNPSTAYDLKKYYPDLFKKFQEQRLKEMFNWVLNNIKRGKKEGLYRNEHDEHIIAKLFVHRNEVLIIESDTFDLNEFTSNKFISEMIIYHIRGIATEKGIEVLNKNQNNIIENEM